MGENDKGTEEFTGNLYEQMIDGEETEASSGEKHHIPGPVSPGTYHLLNAFKRLLRLLVILALFGAVFLSVLYYLVNYIVKEISIL